MSDLQLVTLQMRSPLSSFGLDAEAVAIDASKGVWANEIPHLGYISLRGNTNDPAFASAASSALGVALPVQPCTLTTGPGVKVLWLSPDEWMIVSARERLKGLIADLTAGLGSLHSQVVDNSGGYTQVLLTGAKAREALQHVSVYDVTKLTPGRVVGTTLGKASAYVHASNDGFYLLIRRSFADYIWRYLRRAAAPYGFGVARFEGAGSSAPWGLV